MITANDLEQSWLACIDRYHGNVEAKAVLLAATSVKNPSRVAAENLAAGHAALQKLLTADASAPRDTGPKVTAFEQLNQMAATIYGSK